MEDAPSKTHTQPKLFHNLLRVSYAFALDREPNAWALARLGSTF